MRIITGPTVQFGLDLQYPALRPEQGQRQFVGVHRRPPGLPLPPLRTCWPPWPCGRLSRPPRRVVTPATTTGPPPHPAPTADNAPARSRAGCTRRGRHRTVPTFTTPPVGGVGVQLCPSGIATTTPWAFTVASRRKGISSGKEFPIGIRRSVRTATQPISARFELVGRLRGFTRWFLTYAFPPRLPNPHRLAVPARLGVVRAASHLPRRFPSRAALSFTGLPRQPGGGGLSPPPGPAAPRGARSRPPTGRRSPTGQITLGEGALLGLPGLGQLRDHRPGQPGR